MTIRVFEAQHRVEIAALLATADRYARETDPHADAESEYADGRLALAARELVRAVEALPEADRPVDWDTEVPR